MAPKNVALVGAICVTIGWLLASTLAPPVARVQSRPEPSAPAARAEEPPPLVESLQLRLDELRPAPAGRRNPFTFGARERVATPAVADEQSAPVAALQPAVAITGPGYVLSGIGITGATRSAVLAAGDAVHIVTLNDLVGGYTVTEISDTSVTLVRGDERYVLRFVQP